MKTNGRISVKKVFTAAGMIVLIIAVILAVLVASQVQFGVKDVAACSFITLASISIVSAFGRKRSE